LSGVIAEFVRFFTNHKLKLEINEHI